ncbi:MAG: hypothetical protein ACE5I7_02050 [Candidatus Binatia bacterium]
MRTALIAKRGSTAVWALLLGTSLLYFFSVNEADNDLWGHLLFGREILAAGAIPRVDTFTYTAGGHPWMNHEWLSQVVLAATYQWGGSPGLLLLKFTVAATTCLLLFALIRRRTDAPYLWGAVGLLVIAVLARGFAMRPQIFTYLGTALTLWLLSCHQRGRYGALWFFPLLFVIWANLHGGFILGLGILGLFAGAELVHAPQYRARLGLAVIASAAATLFNPYGPKLLVYVWTELQSVHPITEWQRAVPADVAQFAFFAMLGVFVLTLPCRRDWRQRGWEALLALGVGLLALRHQRHTPVFAVCAAVPLATQLQSAKDWLARRSPFALSASGQRLIAGAVVALASLQLCFTGLRYHRDGLQIVFDPSDYPTAAVRTIREANVQLNLAVPLGWGEYVLWFLAPRVKVSLDGRFATVFSERVIRDNFDFFSGAPTWRHLVDDYPTQAALVPVAAPCPIRREAGWRRVYGDTVAEVYVRTDRAPSLLLGAASGQPPPAIFP